MAKKPLAELRVLVVDDSQVVRSLVRSALREMGIFETIEATNGLEALRWLEREMFDLVISDLNMPQMNGLQLLVRLRTGDWQKQTPFVMLTADGNKENVLEAVKQGASSYIVKPFTADTIQGKVMQVLGAKVKEEGLPGRPVGNKSQTGSRNET